MSSDITIFYMHLYMIFKYKIRRDSNLVFLLLQKFYKRRKEQRLEPYLPSHLKTRFNYI